LKREKIELSQMKLEDKLHDIPPPIHHFIAKKNYKIIPVGAAAVISNKPPLPIFQKSEVPSQRTHDDSRKEIVYEKPVSIAQRVLFKIDSLFIF
jgi:hypothetical protein